MAIDSYPQKNSRGCAIDRENYAGCGWHQARRLRCLHATRIPDPLTHYVVSKKRGCRDCASSQHSLSLRCVAVLARTTAQSQCHFRLLHCGVQCPRTWHLTRGHVTCSVDSTQYMFLEHRRNVSFLTQTLCFVYV
jgi:hypothetical protein